MALSTLTSKGQVTIPKSVRDALNLQKGDKIDFVENERHEFVIKPATKKVAEVVGLLKRYKRDVPVSVDEMDEAVARQIEADKA